MQHMPLLRQPQLHKPKARIAAMGKVSYLLPSCNVQAPNQACYVAYA